MSRYQVLVGDVGVAYETDSEPSARAAYGAYVKRSLEWSGRCGGKAVTLMENGEIVEEHTPDPRLA